MGLLFSIETQEGKVEHQCDPVSVDEEEEGQKSVNGGFWDDVRVESVAQIDGVDVVAVMRKC